MVIEVHFSWFLTKYHGNHDFIQEIVRPDPFHYIYEDRIPCGAFILYERALFEMISNRVKYYNIEK